jgi:hypothetical protein
LICARSEDHLMSTLAGTPSSDEFVRGIGFAQALGLNTGAVGSGENRMELYVR